MFKVTLFQICVLIVVQQSMADRLANPGLGIPALVPLSRSALRELAPTQTKWVCNQSVLSPTTALSQGACSKICPTEQKSCLEGPSRISVPKVCTEHVASASSTALRSSLLPRSGLLPTSSCDADSDPSIGHLSADHPVPRSLSGRALSFPASPLLTRSQSIVPMDETQTAAAAASVGPDRFAVGDGELFPRYSLVRETNLDSDLSVSLGWTDRVLCPHCCKHSFVHDDDWNQATDSDEEPLGSYVQSEEDT